MQNGATPFGSASLAIVANSPDSNIRFQRIVFKESISGGEPVDRQNIVPLGPDYKNAFCRKAI